MIFFGKFWIQFVLIALVILCVPYPSVDIQLFMSQRQNVIVHAGNQKIILPTFPIHFPNLMCEYAQSNIYSFFLFLKLFSYVEWELKETALKTL